MQTIKLEVNGQELVGILSENNILIEVENFEYNSNTHKYEGYSEGEKLCLTLEEIAEITKKYINYVRNHKSI